MFSREEPLWEHPRAVWERMGEAGRELLKAQLTFGLAPNRKSSKTLIIVENEHCAPHPLELVAREWGCVCGACTQPNTFGLEAKPLLHDGLARGSFHGALLVLVFLTSPDLAFPPDIPEYAVRCLDFIRRQEGALSQKALRERKKERAEAAFAAAYRGKKA